MRIVCPNNHLFSEIELVKASLSLLFEVSYMSDYLIDLEERKFLYAHTDSDFLLGLTAPKMLEMSVDEYYLQYYSTKTLSFLKKVYLSSKILFSKLTDEYRNEFRVVVNLMIQKSSNTAQFVQHRIIPIQIGDVSKYPRYLFVGVALSSNRNKRSAIAICGNMLFQSRYKFNKETSEWDMIPPFELTDSEKILLSLMYEGHNYKEIAKLMYKSQQTVKTYKRNLFNKMGVNSTAEAISFALTYHLF